MAAIAASRPSRRPPVAERRGAGIIEPGQDEEDFEEADFGDEDAAL